MIVSTKRIMKIFPMAVYSVVAYTELRVNVAAERSYPIGNLTTTRSFVALKELVVLPRFTD